MVIERKKVDVVDFGSLKPGDCFESDAGVYVKMYPIYNYNMEGDKHIYNCFWVTQNHAFWFRDEDKVTPLNMKLVEV